MLELIVNLKFGFEEFSRADRSRILNWVIIMILSTLVGLITCYASGYVKQRIAPVKYSHFDNCSADELDETEENNNNKRD